MPLDELLFEVSKGVAIITVNRPQSMNSLNQQAREELIKLLELAKDREDIKVLIITGMGEKAFISGAEISEVENKITTSASAFEDARRGQVITNMIERLPKPVIAAVNGAALGGGMEIMLACDFCIATEKAVFGLPEVKIGFIPGWGGTQRIIRTLGKKGAMRFALLGETVQASEAQRLGLVNEVVPYEQLIVKALQLANQLMKNSPFAMSMVKKAIIEGMDMPLSAGLEFEAGLEAICFASEDKKEGIKAFLEKRRPQFTGK